MTTWNLQVHPDLWQSLEERPSLKHKVNWTLVQLALNGGMTIRVKGWSGSRVAWRRTPVKGNQYYLWWVPQGVAGTEEIESEEGVGNVFVRDVCHHDSNTAPDLGRREEYRPVQLSEIDPRYQDQRDAANLPPTGITIRVVSGLPGSGKTVALQFAVLDIAKHSEQILEQPDILYVTYTDGLVEQAEALFAGYGVEARVKVCTLSQLEREILDRSDGISTGSSPGDDYLRFENFLKRLPNAEQGSWQKDPTSLWAELRAYLVGMALPFSWSREGVGQISAGKILDREVYRQIRHQVLRGAEVHLDTAMLDKAYDLCSRVMEQGILAEQDRAYLAIQKLQQHPGKLSWLPHLNAVIVDEVQDLTVRQIALLAEVGRQATIKRNKTTPFLFVIAGDESQIVQPSGFDWGIAKDLLRERLGSDPEEYKLHFQRRSPKRLAQLINRSWGLYEKLEKEMRPKGKAESEPREGDEEGILLRWQIDNTPNYWAEVFKEFCDYPNLAFVDLSGSLPEIINRLDEPLRSQAKSFVYTPGQIKGLERRVVVVSGIDEISQRLQGLQASKSANKFITLCQIRRDIDNIRVALSRATHMLVIAERDGTQLADDLGLLDTERVDWNTLRETLRREEQDITILDKIFAYLRNAEESFQRGDYECASEQNKQAQHLLSRVDDQIVARQVQEQQEKIRRKLTEREVRGYLQRAKELERNQEFGRAFDEWEKAHSLLSQAADPSLSQEVNDFWDDPKHLEQAAIDNWNKAEEAKDKREWSTAAQRYSKVAHIKNLQGKPESAEIWQCLADRYGQLPPDVSQGDDEQVKQLVEFIVRYVDILESTGTGTNEKASQYAKDWLGEACDALGDKEDLYLPWAKAAKQIFEWENVHFLDIDKYSKFAAAAWMAAERLRKAGKSEDALELLKIVEADIPEKLRDIVKIFQYLDGLEDLKKNLHPAEVERLVNALENGAKSLKAEGGFD